MAAGDKSDFLVPGGGLRSPLLSRAVGAVENAETLGDRDGREAEGMHLIGSRIGPYRILSLLGTGGMGSVYLADQTDEAISRRVALKVLRHVGLGRGGRDRFARERRILASLAHPNIAALYDSGEMDAGELFYTMEYVQGMRIHEYCKERAPTVATRIAVLRDVASALACAHRSLIIHRDIKPSNVLVSAEGHVKLLDFGIAKSLTESADPDSKDAGLTQNSTGPMTPQYAAPEQFHGATLTVATDVYQFGVLTFHVLTGRLPLRADPRDPVAWARAVAEEEPLSLTRTLSLTTQESTDGETTAWAHGVRLGGVRQALGGDLEAIVAKSLAKEPQQRYVSMEALNADLGAFLEGRPVSARRAGAFYRMRRFVARNRAASMVALVALFAIAAGSWVAIDRLRVERDRATAASTMSRATTDFLVGLFTSADTGQNRGERLTANQILERGATQLQNHPSDDPAIEAAVAIEIGRVYISLDEFDRAKKVLSAALARGSRVPPDSPLIARLLLMRGWAEYMSAAYPAAAQDYTQARDRIALIGDAKERDHAATSLAQRQATLARRTGKLDEAAASIHLAIELADRDVPRGHLSLGPLWNELGIIERNRGDNAASIAAYQKALDIYHANLGDLDTRTLGTQMNLGEVLMFDDQEDKAEKLFVDGIASSRKLQDGPTTMEAGALNLLSQIRLDQKRYAKAGDFAQQADDIYVKLLGPRHNYRAFALVHVGHARLGLKDGPGALAAFTLALELRRSAFGNEHPDTANALWNLGDAEEQLGDFVDAEKHLREAVEIRARLLPPGHVAIPRTRLKLIDALIDLERYEEAQSEFAVADRELKAARDTSHADRDAFVRVSTALASHRSLGSSLRPRP